MQGPPLDMDAPPPLPPRGRGCGPAWSLAAALAGLGCFVAPSLLLARAYRVPVYGHPLLPWLERSFNADIAVYGAFLFVLGLVLGVLQPRRWGRLGLAAPCLPPMLHAIDVVHDCILDPTSHNLWPFEFALLAAVSWPSILGSFLGSVIGARVAHGKPEPEGSGRGTARR